MSFENDLKALLPTTLWDSLLIDFDNQNQILELRLDELTSLCLIQCDDHSCHLKTTLLFRTGPTKVDHLPTILGREVFQIKSPIQKHL